MLLDERHQVGRVGYRRHKKKVPVVTVGHTFAARVGGWYNPSEYWGEFLTQPFTFRRSPQNEADGNAIMITSSRRGKFLGYLSKELGAILTSLVKSKQCAISGVAGLITIEISRDAKLLDNAVKYLEWLEASLIRYRDSVSPDHLPVCPVSTEDLANM